MDTTAIDITAMETTETPAAVLRFWFEEIPASAWFRGGPAGDRTVRERFGPLSERALEGGLASWADAADHALALILVLDQFPRQIWRDQARAFAGDARAQALALKALEAGWVAAEPAPERRPFWLMPLMHSEDLALQERGLPLFERHCDARTADFARRHHAVIARFGRFPIATRRSDAPAAPRNGPSCSSPAPASDLERQGFGPAPANRRIAEATLALLLADWPPPRAPEPPGAARPVGPG